MSLLVQGSRPQQEKLLFQSTSLYVGNMSFYTTEEQLYELFGKVPVNLYRTYSDTPNLITKQGK
jgi:RNA recognition motif-containing protein